MKPKMNSILILVLLLASASFAKDPGAKEPAPKEPEPLVLHGAIMDSQCAYNVHSLARSHDWMIRKSVAGAKDAKTCTLHCVRERGGIYVLLVKQEVYRLDDQVQTEIYSGKNVKVTGPLDEKTHTIHVLRVEEDK